MTSLERLRKVLDEYVTRRDHIDDHDRRYFAALDAFDALGPAMLSVCEAAAKWRTCDLDQGECICRDDGDRMADAVDALEAAITAHFGGES